jgi:hypothetical protein
MDKNGQKLLKIMELISGGDGMLNEGALDNELKGRRMQFRGGQRKRKGKKI